MKNSPQSPVLPMRMQTGPISTGGCAFIVTALAWRAPRSTLVVGRTANPATCEKQHVHTVGAKQNEDTVWYGTCSTPHRHHVHTRQSHAEVHRLLVPHELEKQSFRAKYLFFKKK